MNAHEMSPEEREAARTLLSLALQEDHAHEDVTSRLTVPADAVATVQLCNRQPGCLAGGEVLELALEVFDSAARVDDRVPDGGWCDGRRSLARLSGPWRDLLAIERSALNLMGLLSGTATLTHAYVEAAGPSCRIYDTRKTYPGARLLQKYAVRCGGGVNHRLHLGDGFLLKDNHRHAGIGWGELVRQARELGPEVPVVIEVDSLEQFDEVLEHGPDRILLDNFDLAEIEEARRRRDERAPAVGLEVSGGVTLAQVPDIAAAGADCVSVGALTHSAPTWDLGFDLVSVEA
jgi:nicotinate-nucleotide pyrophosphorylase (carboxylating)